MTRESLGVGGQLQQYILDHATASDGLLEDLAAETHSVLPDRAGMQIGRDQFAFMSLLVRLIGAKQAVEVGTFTGMSSLAILRGLPEDGKLICFDMSEEYTSIARRYWERDGQSSKVELRIGDARKNLGELPKEAALDFVFIDADKGGYLDYWEELVPRVRSGGVIAVDNVLWSGRVVDPDATDDNTKAIRVFNDHSAADSRVEQVILPVGDGVTLARKR
ncbi:MAG TPA: class I SAM-dependent methyltransferase [Candidatus Stackebrandtia excrementipullorum]|nr:class I SAM-dependent methyltransferase [Candidatus Stackebrandtia excrementipullorum]